MFVGSVDYAVILIVEIHRAPPPAPQTKHIKEKIKIHLIINTSKSCTKLLKRGRRGS